jgi:hypothetical protein
MSGFKLLGIRPLKECDAKFRKILKTKRLYLFDQIYDIDYNDDNEVIGIFFDAKKDIVPTNFYSNKLNIQINAIVGGNGSGKSALAELFLYFMFYYGLEKEHISKNQFLSDLNSDDEGYGAFDQIKYTQEINLMKVHLNVELLYIYNDVLYRIVLKSSNFEINRYKQDNGEYTIKKKISFKNFIFPFYSMYVNYSHYGLNTNVDGLWLKTLFHKNDGYQLPIVINPYRNKGNININVENYLSRDRVFTNVINTADQSLILPNFEINFIEIARDSLKPTNKIEDEEKRLRNIKSLIIPIYKKFYEGENYPSSHNNYQSEVEDYLLLKIKIITERYSDYKQYNNLIKKLLSNLSFEEEELESFLQNLYRDRSHVTLKIRQSLNFLRQDFYQINYEEASKQFKLADIIEKINEIRDDQYFTETIDYLPPPIFMTRFHFKDKSHFDQLSSGEKQQVYSIHSIMYHLKNIDSVHKSNRNKLKYNSVFFILDEIELYYHPQTQKKTVDRLLYVLGKSNLRYVKYLNILFLTHSPFILSDIPKKSVLKLIDGRIDEGGIKTFGANVHDILSENFFLKDGFMGDFAQEVITDLINYLTFNEKLESSINNVKPTRNWNEKSAKQLIKIIDEPLIKERLESLYEKKTLYNSKELLRLKIQQLNNRLNKLEDEEN